MMPYRCNEHGGINAVEGKPVDDIMRMLPERQANPGRHGCTYCAFEEGRQWGIRQARTRIASYLGCPIDQIPEVK